jgi:hypothetical protein
MDVSIYYNRSGEVQQRNNCVVNQEKRGIFLPHEALKIKSHKKGFTQSRRVFAKAQSELFSTAPLLFSLPLCVKPFCGFLWLWT